MGNATFMFTGDDLVPATDCSAFAKAMQDDGVQATYHDVPYLNGGTAHTVTVKLTP